VTQARATIRHPHPVTSLTTGANCPVTVKSLTIGIRTAAMSGSLWTCCDPVPLKTHAESSLRRGAADCFSSVADCDEIHVYADDLWSFSDAHGLAASIPEYLRERQFLVYGIDPVGPLASRLRELLPCARFAEPHDLPQTQD
jgi:hypothetical protein